MPLSPDFSTSPHDILDPSTRWLPAAVYNFVYVDQESFEKYPPRSFADLIADFRQYQ